MAKPSSWREVRRRKRNQAGRNEEIDDEHCAELLRLDTAATEETPPQAMRQHLIRDIGPGAVEAGTGSWATSMGLSSGGHLQG